MMLVDVTGKETMYSAVPTTEPPQEQGGNTAYVDGGLTDKQLKARLGMAKTIEILGGMESAGVCAVEKTSVYGDAVAMPQIARSAGYPKSMVVLAFRAYLFVLLNYFCQCAFVYYIYDSQSNMNPFGGQMHLCDFAAHIADCPDGPGCVGPGGETIDSPGDLYPFDIWLTRRFVKESLTFMFPDRKSEINSNIDPGEYALESYYCRWLCIFIFVLQIADEFQNIRDLVHTVRRIPTDNSPWIDYTPGVKDCHNVEEVNNVSYMVSGMPMKWKIMNTFIVLLPRIFIWRMLTMSGVHFLMETAAMVDQIVNTTALSFILTTDELIFERLATRASRHIIAEVKDYERFDDTAMETRTDQETMDRYNSWELSWCHRGSAFPMFPKRLGWTLFLMAIFVVEYYWHNCISLEDGSRVSKKVFLPISPHLDIWCFVKKFFSIASNAHEDEEFWSMPRT